MGVRKLGAITGIVMIFFIFIGTLGPVDLYIVALPKSGLEFIKFYTWGYVDGSISINMFTLSWPSCLYTWLTTISFMASVAMTIAASTPGSVPENAKRMFGISTIFTVVHAMFYLMMILFSSLAPTFYLLLGPGFYALVLFSISNIISYVKVE
ncbi:MAG: hypothetical protein ACTSUE_13255 [Promethearchaeota archaeon]